MMSELKEQIKRVYILAGELPTMDFDIILKMWEDDLSEIPEESLGWAFKEARMNNKYKILKSSQVLEAFHKKKGFDDGDKVIKEMMRERLKHQSLFPPHMVGEAERYLRGEPESFDTGIEKPYDYEDFRQRNPHLAHIFQDNLQELPIPSEKKEIFTEFNRLLSQ